MTVVVFLGMTLYLLLRHVNRNVATAMVILVAIATTIMSLDKVFQFAALRVAGDAAYATAFGVAGSNALVLLLLDIHNYGFLIAQIFFGLWLAPLGYLAYKSGMFPRALGVVLIVAAVSYLVDVLAAFSSPDDTKTLPFETGDHVDEGPRRHSEHEDQSNSVERQRASDRSAEKQEQSEDRDRCERRAHARREGSAVPAPDVAEQVAQPQTGGRDQHHPAQPLHSLPLPKQLYERNCRERPEERRDRIRDDDAQLIELDRCPRLTATTKRVHEPGEAREAHRDAGDRKEERLVDHRGEGNRSSPPGWALSAWTVTHL